MKLVKIKPNKKQLKIIKKYWKTYLNVENSYYKQVSDIEKIISKLTGIKDIEIFFCDNEAVGIGNIERTMSLIHLR